MWSTAYGLIALAVVAFVVLYVAVHTPVFAPTRFADQLYDAKRVLYVHRPWMVTDNATIFNEYVNVTYVVLTYETVRDPTTGQWVSFPLYLPYAYKGEKREADLVYSIYLAIEACRNVTAEGGQPATLYVVKLAHPQLMPWLDVYALVPYNLTEMLLYYYFASKPQSLNSPPPPPKIPVFLLDDPYYGSRYLTGHEFRFVYLVKTEWALVRDPDGSYTLYVLAPPDAVGIYVVDYPLALPLSCW